jgi:hypothetical protein
MRSVAKLYLRKGFLIYKEMRKKLTIYVEAVSHIWLSKRSYLNFLIYEENLIFFFIGVWYHLSRKFEIRLIVSIAEENLVLLSLREIWGKENFI